MTELSPCPFCGSANLRYEFVGSQGYICCDNCGTQGPCDEQAADPHCSIEAAKDAWNRRATPGNWHKPKAKDLIQRLADGLEDFYDREYGWREDGHGCLVIEEARAYLAIPEPVAGPTDEEWLADFETWLVREMPPGTVIGDPLWWAPRIARAVLARWGNHAPQPIPISERFPSPEDCDAEGRCWVWNPEMYWWEVCPLRLITINAGDPYDYWLPHWAIPTPQEP